MDIENQMKEKEIQYVALDIHYSRECNRSDQFLNSWFYSGTTWSLVTIVGLTKPLGKKRDSLENLTYKMCIGILSNTMTS